MGPFQFPSIVRFLKLRNGLSSFSLRLSHWGWLYPPCASLHETATLQPPCKPPLDVHQGLWAPFEKLNSRVKVCQGVQTNPRASSASKNYGALVGLAAAAATLCASTVLMEAENLKAEAEASSRSICPPEPTTTKESAETVTEKFTGIQFPLQVQIPKSRENGGTYHLLGTAVRCMLGACSVKYARAYAVAVYIEEGQQAVRWLPGNGPSPTSPEGLRRELLAAAGVGRLLRLVMDRDVEGHHIAKGFDRSLIPRVRERQGGFKKGDGKSALKQFTKIFFAEKTLKTGTKVELLWRPDNSLVTSIDGRVVSVIHSPILCQSLFDTYFGPENIFSRYNNTAFHFMGQPPDQTS